MTEDSRNAELLRDIIEDEPNDLGDPQSRNEAILMSIIDETAYDEEPQSRIEELLLGVKDKIEHGGGYPEPTGTIQITANGSGINVKDYATADVAVPNPSTGTRYITQNGTFDVTSYASANVSVQSSISSKNVTIQNDTGGSIAVSAPEEGVWVSKTIAAGGSDTFKVPAGEATYGKKRLRFLAMLGLRAVATYTSSTYPVYNYYCGEAIGSTLIYWGADVTNASQPKITITLPTS